MDRDRDMRRANGRLFLAVGAMFVAVVALFSVCIVDISRAIVSPTEADVEEQLNAAFPHVLPVAAAQSPAVSLFIAGDVMLDRGVADRIRAAKNPAYPFQKVLTDDRFTTPDLRVMNLEGPVTPSRRPPEKSIDFAFDPSVITGLTLVGWNAASQANNHTLDQGRVGADDSRSRLRKAGILVFGDEVNDNPSFAVATTTVHGRRIAFVGLNETSNGIAEKDAEASLATARVSADTVIVCMHWGREYEHRPTADQTFRAEWLIDHGADVVIGGHPHWVQSVTSYKGKPIVYSLGNFVFDQDWSVETGHGLAVSLLVSDAETVIAFHPIDIVRSQPVFLDGQARADRLRELADMSDASLAHQIQEGRVAFLATK